MTLSAKSHVTSLIVSDLQQDMFHVKAWIGQQNDSRSGAISAILNKSFLVIAAPLKIG